LFSGVTVLVGLFLLGYYVVLFWALIVYAGIVEEYGDVFGR